MMILLAAISGEALVTAVVWVLVLGLIFGLVYWLIDYCAVPEPFNRIARVVLAIIAVLALVNLLLSIVGKPFIVW